MKRVKQARFHPKFGNFIRFSFEDLCRKSFLMSAILLCNWVTRCLAFFQLFENFFFPAMRRCNGELIAEATIILRIES